MIGNAFRSVGQFISRTIDDVVEIGQDIASDAAPVAVKSVVAAETSSVPFFLFNTIRGLTQAKAESESRDTTRDQRIEEKAMPHVEGHMPIEIPPMQGQIRYESPSEAFVGGLTQAIPGLVTNVLRGLRGPVGGTAGGLAGGVAGSMLMDGRDVCGCQPKPFVRLNKCGEPIITRKMKKQAIEAINCNGPEVAAATLTGGDLQLLTAIVSKQFPPVRRGLSGSQLKSAQRVNRTLLRMTERLGYKCTPMRS